MSLFMTGNEFSAALLEVPIGLILIGKWTILLAVAWLAHGALAGRNPRWRVALWRWAVAGLILVGALSFAPAIVTYRFAPARAGVVEVERRVSTAFDGAARVTRAVVPASEPARAISAARPTARAIPAGDGTGRAATARETAPASARVSVAVHAFRWVPALASWLWSIWLAGVFVLMARLIAGSVALMRIIGRSSVVSDEIIAECRMVAARMGCRVPVRVRQTADLAIPCLVGFWRPVVLLPECECQRNRSDDLRAIFAHELGHIRGHDVIWNNVLHLISLALWFHPLVWRIRGAHAADCDMVCDGMAADMFGDAAAYSRTLARLALQAASKMPATGLAMARSSDVRRRIESLNRAIDRSPLPHKTVIAALLAFGSITVLLGGVSVLRAERPASERADAVAQAEAQKPANRLVLRAISAESGQAIEGVAVEYWVRAVEKVQRATIFTGEDGTATIEWAHGAVVAMLELTARAPGLVPIDVRWDSRHHPVQLPQEKELRFQPAIAIGGIVHDEAGRPIEGASVDVNAPATEYEGGNYFFSLGSAKTDSEGRWRIDSAPKNLASVSVRVTHPKFQWNGAPAARGFERVIVLKKGLTVTGTVVDGTGRPVRGAKVILGSDTWGTASPTAMTNELGKFVLENCNRGPSVVTVQADGFAPELQDVRVEERTAPVEFHLTEPGAVLRVRVVDVRGKPVAGVTFGPDTWRGHRSIHFRGGTGPDGRVEWRSAPKDVVFYYAGKADFMWIRDMPLTATEREQTITLYPKLVITGRVTEAGSGRAVPKFRVVKGSRFPWDNRLHWFENEAVEITGGHYEVAFDEPRKELLVKIEATGFKPAESRPFRPDEGSQTFDAVLERDAGISGIVVLPDGKPAAGTEVALSAGRARLVLRAGRLDRNADFPKTLAGSGGRFWFPARAGQFDLIAISDAGFAEASSVEFAKSGKLVLKPWGRIEGFVQIGPRIGVNQEVMFQPTTPSRQAALDITYWYGAYTDDRGRFQLDRVVPGAGTVSRVVRDNPRPRGAFAMLACWPQRIEIVPGQTIQVTIGGKGRPVTGRIALDGTPELPIDWTLNQPVLLHPQPDKPSPRPARFRRSGENLFASFIDKDGRFRIEDVPAGRYELALAVEGAADPRFVGAGRGIGKVSMTVNVPETSGGRSNQPLDLGTVTAKLFDMIKIGDVAPDFDVERIGIEEKGRRLKLSDYRGKLVLLNFWEGRGNQIDMTVLREVQQSFGNDPRFVLVSLACGSDAAAAEKGIKKNELSWTHGFAGEVGSSGAAGHYKIKWISNAQIVGPDQKYRRIPVTFLIGPDGRILGHDLTGGDLEAVRKALENPIPFPPALEKLK